MTTLTLAILLLVVVLAAWVGLLGNLLTLHQSDSAGRGLAEVWAYGTVVVLWLGTRRFPPAGRHSRRVAEYRA